MFIVIGSTALQMHGVDTGRLPKDLDILGDYDSVTWYLKDTYPQHEFSEERLKCTYGEKVHFYNKEMDLHIELDRIDDNIGHNNDVLLKIIGTDGWNSSNGIRYALPEWIRWFKESHKYKKDSPHFWKTRIDLVKLRKYDLPFNSEDLLKEREKLTYTNVLPNLKQRSNTFFREEESFYRYKHDDIHKAIAILPNPAYTYYMADNEEVMCSKDKFFDLPESVRLLGVLEEAGVLSLERSLIPFDFEPDQDYAFKMALSKVCTSITGGWFREYAYDNVFKVMYLYDKMFKDTYVSKFKEALSKGEIANFKES